MSRAYPRETGNLSLEEEIRHLYAKRDFIRDDDIYELRMEVHQELCAERIKAV